ncbi:MAG: phosphoribosylformylglycinamidine synthase subunit PurQ [Desulfobacterales bacterium]|nr:phosphoribosylformylglycinamidine synthase subunit PurQ [Desulfobacterales bacterium]
MPSNIKKQDINALVLCGYGLNCDLETAHALELAGAHAKRVHINSVIDGSVDLSNFQLMVFVGGFSWGDDHGAGVIQAVRMKKNAGEKILKFVDAGNLVMGICNGFQTIVNLGLLPGFDGNYQDRSVALTFNDCGNFRDDWVHLNINVKSPCVFTKGLSHIELPIRHGEGKFVADAAVMSRLINENQVVCRYASPDGAPAAGRFPDNPNGSMHDIAGICDPTGRIFGLMPHPEAFNHATNHPDWGRFKEQSNRGEFKQTTSMITGIRLFETAINNFWL